MRRRAAWLLALLPIVAPLAAFALATVETDPRSVTFGQRCVRTSAAAKTITVENRGSPEAVDVTVSISPSSRADVFPLEGPTARPTLAPNESFEFSVGFDPEQAGTSSAHAVIGYKAVQPTPTKSKQPTPSPTPKRTTVALKGSAIDRFVDASPRALNFGSVRVGRPGPQRTVTIYDDGDSPLTVTGLSLGGRHPGDFALGRRAPFAVTDADPVPVTVRFTPRRAGARAARLTITTNACEDPTVTVDLAGVGTEPDIVPLPAEVDLGEARIGRSAKETLTLQNQGQFDLRVSEIGLAGTDKDLFSVGGVPDLPRTLRSGQRIELTLRFRPTEAIVAEATLVVRSSDPDTRRLRIPVRAEGVLAPSPTPSPTGSAEPTIVPPPPTTGNGFSIPLGDYVPEIAVGSLVLAFFVLLVVVRRLRGIPE